MNEEDTARITERIEEFRRHLGLSKSDFCKVIAFPLGTYSNITGSRQSKPNAELLAAIATHTQVNPHWLLTGEGGMLAAMARPAESGSEGGAPAMFTAQELADQYVLVPFYDVRGSAGGGSYVHDVEVIDRLAFRAEWIYRELRVRPEHLALISASGDSMEPTISHADLLLVNINQNSITDDAIYAIQTGEVLLIKRIQTLLDGTIIIRSDNPSYREQVIRKEEADSLRVVARVVWIARRV